MRLFDRWNAIIRLLLFNDERGTVSEHVNGKVAETKALAERLGAETEDAVFDMQRDPLKDLLDTFPERRGNR